MDYYDILVLKLFYVYQIASLFDKAALELCDIVGVQRSCSPELIPNSSRFHAPHWSITWI